MAHKTYLITGASRGIGRVTTLELAERGANLILVGRDTQRTEQAAQEALALGAAKGTTVTTVIADLSHLKDVARAAQEILESCAKLDALINNAGAIFDRHIRTADGIENTFALNHLAYFALTLRLLPLIQRAPQGRIINVASRAHEGAQIDLEKIVDGRPYHPWKAYQASKLANILFSRELASRLKGTAMTVNALHPGFVATQFGHGGARWMSWFLRLARPWMINEEQGAKTSVFLAVDDAVANISGAYWVKCTQSQPSLEAQNNELARALWNLSVSLTGLDLPSTRHQPV
ncbi:MAG: SDR family oxidoreductase [Candidatus Sericytochromatia bacterium]|nr:SDR family oxidoreductase [Candidatus Sericytochromatia bacterium]